MPTNPTTGTPTRTNGQRFRRIARILRNKQLPCALCGQPINYNANVYDPDSFTVDHTEPISHGGKEVSITNTRPAHRRCNARRGDATRELDNNWPTSRQW